MKINGPLMNLRVSNGNMGVSNENMGPPIKLGGLQRDVNGGLQ